MCLDFHTPAETFDFENIENESQFWKVSSFIKFTGYSKSTVDG
jgi:hypothetical protein